MVKNGFGRLSLKKEIIGPCKPCKGTGFDEDGHPCGCMLKFRAFNRMITNGFSRKSLDLVSSPSYDFPVIDQGEEFVNLFYKSPEIVEDKGLSLFIHSKEKGRGKTTLAHSLVYNAAYYYSETSVYKSARTYQFLHIEDLIALAKKDKFDFCKSTWLVIDDLGNEDKAASWKQAIVISALQRLLHYRRDHSLSTILTSNYAPSSLSLLYKGDLDSLMEIGYDGHIKGILFREIEVGGGEDFRIAEDLTQWPI